MKIPLLSSAAFLVAIVFSACGGDGPAAHRDEAVSDASHLVQAYLVRLAKHPIHRELTGSVRPQTIATIRAQVSGQVVAAAFEIGDAVSKGDLLVELQVPELEAQVEAAEARLAEIEGDLARERSLLENNASTREQVRSLTDRRRQAAARLEEARAVRRHAKVTAPFDGSIARKWIEVGDLARPGLPLLELEQPGKLEIATQLPGDLPIPDSYTWIEVTDGDVNMHASITAVAASLDSVTRSRSILLQIPEQGPELSAGQFVRILWPDRAREMMVIPGAAIRRNGPVEQVFVIQDQIARMRLIRSGMSRGQDTQVHAGLSEGETVVLNPPSLLRDGSLVEVVP